MMLLEVGRGFVLCEVCTEAGEDVEGVKIKVERDRCIVTSIYRTEAIVKFGEIL